MFGPWAYQDMNVAWKAVPDEEAGIGEEQLLWREFSPRQRELLHELPIDYTRLGLMRGPNPRVRGHEERRERCHPGLP